MRHVDLVPRHAPAGRHGLSLIPAEADRGAGTTSFVVLSASVLPAERANALASGASGFLAKPYRPADLIDVVAEVLGTGN
jgi:CheY-like chemotaxis protein